ncbi:DNA-processing protein DprA [Leekyejoonella antrihumi]|uniref:DNA-processing protein DprA n=1 Tax=Leekyejoonella antrihumi TaxID=1660198 RepID=A0A563E7L9_9MICO|nr:DNA-processing protein DprA [Leekyejoonella antrihumi]TWP38526.1 DNA-processing protein DprA [Leekyejoonella antrihumi]
MEPDERETAALLALLRTKPRGTSWGSIAGEVSFVGSAIQVLDGVSSEGLFRSPEIDEALSAAARDIARWKQAGLTWVTVLDDRYPHRLRDIREAPPFLFYSGDLRAADQGMSVVGSRAASDWGVRFAADAAHLLVRSGLSVVSGLAEGIDASAHRATLDAGGRTVAFLGTGITRSYPAKNRDLQSEIGARGLVLSQFYPDMSPTKHTFPMRNATMSGYGLATIVVEAGEQSGARIQARVAGEHGRPVILTRRVVDGTTWGADMAQRANVRVIGTSDELEEAVGELRGVHDRLESALEALTAE